jgi:transketolase
MDCSGGKMIEKIQKKANRDAFGETLLELGRENKNIVVLSGDLEDSTRAEYFKKEFPERFFNMGISEQDMVGTAAGFSTLGFIPFAASFSVFLTNRAYDFIRITICFNNLNVKLVGTHAGITVGADGATAQCLEDIAIMRVLPNMTVVCPCDANETTDATKKLAALDGPAYLRLGRNAVPIITKKSADFNIGKAKVMRKGNNIGIIACGIMVSEALHAAEVLSEEGIEAEVLNMHTLKPVDESSIKDLAKKCKAIVTAEEHQLNGGLGSIVAEVLSRNYPVPLEMVGIKDRFGESGTPEELQANYNLKYNNIVDSVKKVIKRKNIYFN